MVYDPTYNLESRKYDPSAIYTYSTLLQMNKQMSKGWHVSIINSKSAIAWGLSISQMICTCTLWMSCIFDAKTNPPKEGPNSNPNRSHQRFEVCLSPSLNIYSISISTLIYEYIHVYIISSRFYWIVFYFRPLKGIHHSLGNIFLIFFNH